MDSANRNGYPQSATSNGYSVSTSSNGYSARSHGDVARPGPLRVSPNANLSKAEIFEDEKRSIVSSCFLKTDNDGKALQSYITHIRVEEDAAYQSGPPPPGANPLNKKPRVIIVAVKASGRVSMHKARQNEDGSFQIGKTWGLEELQSIETFASSPSRHLGEREAQHADQVGFIITMTKPYYWQANSPKEKEFFLGCLVKIYNKFTSGKIPELIGFEQSQRDAIYATLRIPGGAQASQSSQSRSGVLQPTLQARIDPVRQPSANSQYGTSLHESDVRPSSNASGQSSMLSNHARAPSPAARPPNDGMNGPRPYQSNRGPMPASLTPAFQPPSGPRNFTPQQARRPSHDSNSSHNPPTPLYSSPGSNVLTSNQPSRLTPQPSRPNNHETFLPPGPNKPYSLRSRTSDRTLNSRSDSPHIPKSLTPASVSSSTVDRWRPNDRDDRQDDRASAGNELVPEQSAVPSNRSRPDEGIASYSVPERRRPPLEDYERSNSTHSGTTLPLSPQNPVTATLNGPFVEDQALMSSSPRFSDELPGAAKSSAPGVANGDKPSSSLVSQISTDLDQTRELAPGKDETPDAGQEPAFRPGLGPMMSKKAELASKMRKAAIASRAFVPRAGGAGDRLLGKTNTSNEPDGVTGVALPVRSAAREITQDDKSQEPSLGSESMPLASERTETIPPPLTIPLPPDSTSQLPPVAESTPEVPPSDPVPPSNEGEMSENSIPRPLVIQRTAKALDRAQPSKKLNPFAHSFEFLGVDSVIGIDKRTIDFEDELFNFGWERNFLQKKQFDTLQSRMRRVLGTIEAGSWLGNTDDGDARIEQFEKAVDLAINAVDEVDGLLTLYTVELSTLVDDVAYIEAQSHGLQVQTANQKLLHAELEDLLETVSLSADQLQPLRVASFSDPAGLEAVEHSLMLLYKALEKIDPLSINRGNGLKAPDDTSAHGMRALQDRKQLYLGESTVFLQRLQQHSSQVFTATFAKIKSNTPTRSSVISINESHTQAHDHARTELWRYSALMQFAKELDTRCWEDMYKAYQAQAGVVYSAEADEIITRWKRKTQKASTEDDFALFTTPEKETETFTSAARKMTVKRSATLAKGFRSTPNRERSLTIGNSHGDHTPCEAFYGVLDEVMPAISAEQNFIVDFFHVTAMQSGDFLDAVGTVRPSDRRAPDVYTRRSPEPPSNRAMAEKVKSVTKVIFQQWFFKADEMVQWAASQNEFQRIGIMGILERAIMLWDESNQEFLLDTLRRWFENSRAALEPFIDAQIKAIDNVKVKTNKRRGLMSFTRRLPYFVSAIENVLPVLEINTPRYTHQSRGSDAHNMSQTPYSETRALVEKAYTRIIDTIFRNLETIAKGTTTSYATVGLSGSAETEEKEKLNHEILLIENMHHLAANLEPGSSPELRRFRAKAEDNMFIHRERYVDAVVRRPLGRLIDFVDAVGDRPRQDHVSQGRSAFKKALGGYDAKTCRRDVEALRKRVEKHFSPQEGQGSGNEMVSAEHKKLIEDILEACKVRVEEVVGRVEALAGMYEPAVEVEITRQDVAVAFRR